ARLPFQVLADGRRLRRRFLRLTRVSACATYALLVAKKKFVFGGMFLQFHKEFEILAPREKVWRFIWDVDRFIACVPGCKDAKTVEAGKRYSTTMVEKVGPFRVEFPTTIEVLETEELSRIKAQASGADNKIGSRMKIELNVHLRE